ASRDRRRHGTARVSAHRGPRRPRAGPLKRRGIVARHRPTMVLEEGAPMTWYPDLSRFCMAGGGGDVRAVGWLSGDTTYPIGDVTPGFVELLQSHVDSAWQPFRAMGFHLCDLDPCRPEDIEPVPVLKGADLEAARKKWEAARKEFERAREGIRQDRKPRVVLVPEQQPIPVARDPRREARNLYVPTPECVYIAPAMILHYVVAHRYRPPDEFIHPLQQCPPQGSDEYM